MKFLIIRFSSIGDIVLTSPVVRILSAAKKKNEIHYICKERFSDVVVNNPYIHKIYTFKNEITEIISELRGENYDVIIDLHNNLRSKRLKLLLGKKTYTFNKINISKWLMIKFGYNCLPKIHIVERYIETLSFLGLKYDSKGLDYFIHENDEAIFESIDLEITEKYNIIVVGGAHKTKQIPEDMLVEIGKSVKSKIVLLGGNDDKLKADFISDSIGNNCINLVGKLKLNQSAAIVKYADKILTPDTGLMHISAAMKRQTLSVWGNTLPEFGMVALFPKGEEEKLKVYEVNGLKCRPCSKIGYSQCPKKHFRCMCNQDIDGIIEDFS